MKTNFHIILKWLSRILLGYAVVFAFVGTIGLILAFKMVWTPVSQVKRLKNENPRETVFMAVYRENIRRSGKTDTLLHTFVSLDSISPFLLDAVTAAEDDDFYTHPGFDLLAILKAYEYNSEHGKIIRGASTITQQLAKNLFLNTSKTFGRKYKELAYTLLMEHFLGKKRIFELYLNYAQWGRNIFGCEAASLYYFKKPSSKLTINEAVRLSAVLAMPVKLSPLNYQSIFMQQRITMISNNIYLKKKAGFRVSGVPTLIPDSVTAPLPDDTTLTTQDSATLRATLETQDTLVTGDTLPQSP